MRIFTVAHSHTNKYDADVEQMKEKISKENTEDNESTNVTTKL
jgi:hypothetical protein